MHGDQRTYAVIGAAMEVHRILGPGHLEAVYHEALEIELALRGVRFEHKPKLTIHFKGHELKTCYLYWGQRNGNDVLRKRRKPLNL
jgi:GxxExxY protein